MIEKLTGEGLPWIFDGTYVVVDCPPGSYPTVCRVDREPDGFVIAAAPDLYVTLEALYGLFRECDAGSAEAREALREAALALSKARGEAQAVPGSEVAGSVVNVAPGSERNERGG